MAKIGVVTVTYNSGKVLDDFMQSILKQEHKDFILYVIDNDSKDDTLEILTKYADHRVKLIANTENYGVAKGNNQGITASLNDNCDYVLLLNNDTVFAENLLSGLLKSLLENNVDMVTPKMMYFEPKNKIWCAGGKFDVLVRNFHRGEGEIDVGQYDDPYICNYVPTCCLLLRINLFSENQVGMMDEKYFVYYDDTDWMLRAKRFGVKLLYIPSVILLHKVSSLSVKNSEFTITIGIRNKVYFVKKNIMKPLNYLLILSYALTTILKFALGARNKKYFLKSVKAFLIGLRL